MQHSKQQPLQKVMIFTDTYASQINGVSFSIENLRKNMDESVELRIVSSDDFWYVPLP